jgi:hypothetical protein
LAARAVFVRFCCFLVQKLPFFDKIYIIYFSLIAWELKIVIFTFLTYPSSTQKIILKKFAALAARAAFVRAFLNKSTLFLISWESLKVKWVIYLSFIYKKFKIAI